MGHHPHPATIAETIELMLTDLTTSDQASPDQIGICQSAIRTAWIRAAQSNLMSILEQKDHRIFEVLPHLEKTWEDRMVFHEYNMTEYYRQIERFCSYLTLDQARKYAFCSPE